MKFEKVHKSNIFTLYVPMKFIKNRWRLIIIAGVIIFHTTWIKPAVYGEFWPGENTNTQYIDYNEWSLAKALWSSEHTVIYFWANRCPTCKRFEKKLLWGLDQIPSNLTILAADIDRDTQLMKKYSVLSQSTTVYLDKNGKLLLKQVWRDHSLNDILSTIESL